MASGKLIEFSLETLNQWIGPKGNAPVQQQRVLERLLKSASATEFGQFYNFEKILQSPDIIEAFRQTVPFHDYNLIYDRWWHRSLAGEPNVTWKGKVKYFALSSGTSNATSKRLPISNTMFRSLRRAALRLFTNLPEFDLPGDIYSKSWLGIGGTSRLDKIEGHFEGYLSGINARKQPFWAKALYRPGDKIAAVDEFDMRADLIAEQSAQWDIGLIIGIPHWVQLTLERILAANDIKTINEIWPELKVFIFGGVDIKPYRKKLDALVGHPLIYINTYLASEGMMAYQDRADADDLQLILDSGIFFEFVPFDENNFDDMGNLVGSPTAFTIDEVKEGIEYAMIITTCSGAWRYLLGDTVRFTDALQGRIVIAGRTKYYLNLCTEHLTGDNMIAAIARTEEALGITISEFTIAPITEEQYYKHHWYVGLDEEVESSKVKALVDQTLMELNDDYKSERETALFMELEIVPTSWFYEWQQQKSNAAGQSKVPRVIRGKALETWRAFLNKKGYRA